MKSQFHRSKIWERKSFEVFFLLMHLLFVWEMFRYVLILKEIFERSWGFSCFYCWRFFHWCLMIQGKTFRLYYFFYRKNDWMISVAVQLHRSFIHIFTLLPYSCMAVKYLQHCKSKYCTRKGQKQHSLYITIYYQNHPNFGNSSKASGAVFR